MDEESFHNTKIILGDCLEIMEEMKTNSIDSVVSDVPYGLSEPPNPKDVMKEWLERGEYDHDGKGFMGSDWDSFVPSPVYFEEMKRVMKPGAHGAIFAGTRTMDWMGMSLRWAGFEYRDTLMYCYGSGFPKSRNIYKHNDDVPNEFEGYGTQLKPSWEPIILVRKPLEEDTIANNVMEWGTGAINIDDCRIDAENKSKFPEGEYDTDTVVGDIRNEKRTADPKPDGRHPANTTLTHTRWCRKRGTKRVKTDSGSQETERADDTGDVFGEDKSGLRGGDSNRTVTDEDGKETVEDWDCPPSCPVRMLDEQSGDVSYGNKAGGYTYGDSSYDVGGFVRDNQPEAPSNYGDSGGASRFFYTSKADKKQRTMDGEVDNPHPTVKPTDLIEWLTKLITPPEGTVLDPYAGSATGGIAVDRLNGQDYNFNWIGIEQSDEYIEIAKERLQVSYERDWERHFNLEEWKGFDGVGPKTAEDLLDTLGSVKEANFNELESVNGIGPKTAKSIRESVDSQ